MKVFSAILITAIMLAAGAAHAGDSVRSGPPPDVPWQSPAIPTGSVIGVNLAACPSGWTDFAAGQGRFLVGVGTSTDGGSATYALGNTGGENAHRLTVAEMAAHNHHSGLGGYWPAYGMATRYGITSVPSMTLAGDIYTTTSGHSVAANTSPTGNDQPHENRPPYVAVRWCVKT